MGTKLERKHFKLFGKDTVAERIMQIGSLRAGTPVQSKDPDVLQALPNYLEGWPAIVMADNAPAMEDMGALQFVFAYMIATIMEQGVPEWNSATEYFIGSVVSYQGKLYRSVIDENLNNAVAVGTAWVPLSSESVKNVNAQDTYTVINTDSYLRVNAVGSTANLTTVTLPSLADVALGFKVTIKNSAEALSSATVKVVVDDAGTESMDGMVDIDLLSGPPVNESITLVKGSATRWDVI
ncbi:hypothetical protein phi1422_0073 [Bdellovibrio phage phi1422]|uniref:tail fiber protein n=1 Tax=Bdellovibrio phage phi1422 TaxID=1127515 RepID=UPI0002536D98|nr:tail fiber protein [Bdellovibrio phage phi1422]AFC22593.1 hypothetical protein phi1422_0073 [Bdellovibrio phage phi1422]